MKLTQKHKIGIGAFILLTGLIGSYPLLDSPDKITVNKLYPSENLEIQNLYSSSEIVVTGNVESISDARWNTADGNKPLKVGEDDEIYRLATINVQEKIKGEVNSRIQVKIPGGKVDGITYVVTPSPKVHIGEQVVLFLEESGNGYYEIVSGPIGKMSLENGTIKRDVPRNYTQKLEVSKLESFPLEDRS